MFTITKSHNIESPKLITSLPGPKAKAIIDRDRAVTSPSYTREYPLVVERGLGCLIEDVDGNIFLDLTAGIAVAATGHAHPQVVQAIQEQSAKLLHMCGADFYYEPLAQLAETIAARAPFPQTAQGAKARVLFTNSGAESLEGALKLARYYTQRWRVIAFVGGFHGRTYGAMSLTGSKSVQCQGFGPLVPGVTHIPYGTHESLDYLEKQLFTSMLPPSDVAAVVVEAIQGEGGYIVPVDGFLERLREICDRHNILLILDEVQSGMGRTGKLFAVEHWNVMPDIITLAKGIASGLPLGAILSRPEIMTWPPGSHANTFGGNPVACAAANVTLKLLEDGLIENARERGLELEEGLTRLASDYPFISQPHGKGLMLAIDIWNQQGQPDPAKRDHILQDAFYQGLILLGCGKSAIRFCPPLVITSEQIAVALNILHEIFKNYS
ncbi:4-aminobutyrate aminotransferase family protein [Xenococcus sp. PCC 7305]|uniref:acetyl ornithine aminotransferase family protein n=1 Tax=Xenococcus sp. PCC 7305 TaxID=102125 RepID=UPI0002ACBE8A|nr:acetyl ornithine aminotransferase family protein [Xenococcus sp. PCC 7305]ELS02267.1 4-aminobutyrate aminotransferase family protein [Xenococcus sp. PCC 7305]